ncbi:histidine-rich glycoprotein [Drosophila mauritiana]|uniref:Histidine-rich glycoprotein n=1 Tax=Drosophila mauritiana TaxID=7226 RepID=A0A6P8K939_DROMA|nr:histidine-rich glycoprotein [Drosophila mauritiana]
MALRFVVLLSAWMVLAQGSFLRGSDIIISEAEVPQKGYLPVEDASVHQVLHNEPLSAGVGNYHQGVHLYQSQSHHHEHGPHYHLESHHHLSESHHHHQLSESHHLIHGSPQHHYHGSHPHQQLEAPVHEVHGSHHQHPIHASPHHHNHLEAPYHGTHGVHHLHHQRNCHATIHCPRVHSPTYATDGHLCYKVDNSCELAVLNCLRRNELKPVLRHIGHHECHRLPSAHRTH